MPHSLPNIWQPLKMLNSASALPTASSAGEYLPHHHTRKGAAFPQVRLEKKKRTCYFMYQILQNWGTQIILSPASGVHWDYQDFLPNEYEHSQLPVLFVTQLPQTGTGLNCLGSLWAQILFLVAAETVTVEMQSPYTTASESPAGRLLTLAPLGTKASVGRRFLGNLAVLQKLFFQIVELLGTTFLGVTISALFSVSGLVSQPRQLLPWNVKRHHYIKPCTSKLAGKEKERPLPHP